MKKNILLLAVSIASGLSASAQEKGLLKNTANNRSVSTYQVKEKVEITKPQQFNFIETPLSQPSKEEVRKAIVIENQTMQSGNIQAVEFLPIKPIRLEAKVSLDKDVQKAK